METNKDEPEKIIIDLDGAIEKIIEKKQSINRAVILQDSVGCRVELQSNSENVKDLLVKAHQSMNKLNEKNGSKKTPGYT